MYEDKELFGKIKYFFVYEYDEESCMLTYIQWTSNVHTDRYHIKTFKGFDKHDFIEVEYIDQCVGFTRIGGKFYVFDKENQVTYVE